MKNPIKEKDKKKEENGLIRGGGWLYSRARDVQVSYRHGFGPSYRYGSNGLRIVKTTSKEKR